MCLNLLRLLRYPVFKKPKNLVVVFIAPGWVQVTVIHYPKSKLNYVPLFPIWEDIDDADDAIMDATPRAGIGSAAMASKLLRTEKIISSHPQIRSLKLFFSRTLSSSSVHTSAPSFSHILSTWRESSSEYVCIPVAVCSIWGTLLTTPSLPFASRSRLTIRLLNDCSAFTMLSDASSALSVSSCRELICDLIFWCSSLLFRGGLLHRWSELGYVCGREQKLTRPIRQPRSRRFLCRPPFH